MIRRATTADVAGILECLRLAFEPYRDCYTPEGFRDTVLTAETLARVLGTIGYSVAAGGDGHIRGMAVRPEERGTGVAQQLLDAALAGLREEQCRTASLDTTEPLERAMRFYERNGFRRSGVVRDFFGMPLIEYVKQLES